MVCPKCKSKTKVIDVCLNVDENEVYRYRECINEECGHKFHSVEFLVEETEQFKKEWKKSNEVKKGKV